MHATEKAQEDSSHNSPHHHFTQTEADIGVEMPYMISASDGVE